MTLRRAGQKVLLGALVFPGNFQTKEYGIQLVGSEPYDMATVKKMYAAVKKAVTFPAAQSYKDFYLPTFEQEAAAKAGAAELTAAGIETISAARWVSESQCYAGGWAVGRLVQVAPGKIDQAFAAGQLKPTCVPYAEELEAGSSLRERDMSYDGGVRIRTGYWYPSAPQGLSAGYTAPLVRWKGTEISDLTAQPLVLKSYFSQSFLQQHHNFSENFPFWPGADPDIPATQKAELAQKDIVMIYAEDESKVMLIGKDGSARAP